MTNSPSHLVCLLFCTAGQNGENLGSDEAEIVFCAYLLYEVANNKVVNMDHHYVCPSYSNRRRSILTEECKIQTGLDEDAIRNAELLKQVLKKLDKFIRDNMVLSTNSERSFTLLCDGQLHLRLCLQPEACRKNIWLPTYYNKFMDIRKHFQKFYKTEAVNCIKDMLDELSLEETDQSVEYGVRHCQYMANIIFRLIKDGHVFTEVEYIKERLERGIYGHDTIVDDDTVIRVCGLPYLLSDTGIDRFFRGLNVANGGVAMCLDQQGHRIGEALIRFESNEHRDLALRKDNHHYSAKNCVKVCSASGKEFIAMAGVSNVEVQQFLSRYVDDRNIVIIRMLGLPYQCTTRQVLDFFNNGDPKCEVLQGEEGIMCVRQDDGLATVDAFVLFPNYTESIKAMKKHGQQFIGTHVITLYISTPGEMQQLLNKNLDNQTITEVFNDVDTDPNELLPQLPITFLTGASSIGHIEASAIMLSQQPIVSGTLKDSIRLKGLPFVTSVQDIMTFLGEYARNIVLQGVHIVYNINRKPNGESFIQMDGVNSAQLAALNKHNTSMIIEGVHHFIEVMQCSGEDMNMVLTYGISGLIMCNAMHAQFPNTAIMSFTPSLHTANDLPAVSEGAMLPQILQAHQMSLAVPRGSVFNSGLNNFSPNQSLQMCAQYNPAFPKEIAMSTANMMAAGANNVTLAVDTVTDDPAALLMAPFMSVREQGLANLSISASPSEAISATSGESHPTVTSATSGESPPGATPALSGKSHIEVTSATVGALLLGTTTATFSSPPPRSTAAPYGAIRLRATASKFGAPSLGATAAAFGSPPHRATSATFGSPLPRATSATVGSPPPRATAGSFGATSHRATSATFGSAPPSPPPGATAASFNSTFGAPPPRATSATFGVLHARATAATFGSPPLRATTATFGSPPRAKAATFGSPPRAKAATFGAPPPRARSTPLGALPPRATSATFGSAPPSPPPRATAASFNSPPLRATATTFGAPPPRATSATFGALHARATAATLGAPPSRATSATLGAPHCRAKSAALGALPSRATAATFGSPPYKATSITYCAPPPGATAATFGATPQRTTAATFGSPPPRATAAIFCSTPPRATSATLRAPTHRATTATFAPPPGATAATIGAPLPTAATEPVGFPNNPHHFLRNPSLHVLHQSPPYYMNQIPTKVVIKGLPLNAQMNEIMRLLDGIYTSIPVIHRRRDQGPRSIGNVYITFGSHKEAERAVRECNGKLLRNHVIEMYMA